MLENKKIRSILSLLLILNFILIIMCLVRIRFSYTGALESTALGISNFNGFIEVSFVTLI